MPFKIQRVPQGLLNLLNIDGGITPSELEDRVSGVLDLWQAYALQQRRVFFRNVGVVVPLGTVDAILLTGADGPVRNKWAVLFGASMGVIKTATMTAARVSVEMLRGPGAVNSISLASGELGPFGATEVGPAKVSFWAPYPLILVPPWNIFGELQILGTDANCSATCIAEIGVLQ